jgi:hypothetical protein
MVLGKVTVDRGLQIDDRVEAELRPNGLMGFWIYSADPFIAITDWAK